MTARSAFPQAVLFLVIVAALPVRADILIGDFSDSDSTAAHPILRFPDTANGDVAPSGSFTTDLLGMRMQTPFYLTYEPVEGVIYVADFYGQAIRVYAEDAQGNTAPLRTFSSPSLGQPRQVAVSLEHDGVVRRRFRVLSCGLSAHRYRRHCSAALHSMGRIQRQRHPPQQPDRAGIAHVERHADRG